MYEAVHRQIELRRRLLHAAYAALLADPDGFFDATSVSLAEPTSDESQARHEPDFVTKPASELELRAAAYYLVERGLLVFMPAEALARHGLAESELYVHIKAQGIDAFETIVLADENEARSTARQIRFRSGPSSVRDARPATPPGLPAPAVPPLAAPGLGVTPTAEPDIGSRPV